MSNNTWREEIGKDVLEQMVAIYPKDLDLDKKFDAGYGSPEGEPFTLWTKDRVYFPICYDGAEWVCSVPRNPCDIATEHMGG